MVHGRVYFRRSAVAEGAEDKTKVMLGPFFYGWLALSLLINVSGIGSIVDGFVHWAGFFRDSLDIYRHLIREPLSWTVNLVWPPSWWKIPPWVFDLFVIWSAFFLASNIAVMRESGQTIVQRELHIGHGALFRLIIFFLLMPWVICMISFSRDDNGKSSRQILIYVLLLIAVVIVLAFLNWQFQHIGA
jgi:hypothetical protein